MVVGAGLAGLTCAYRLRKAGYNVDAPRGLWPSRRPLLDNSRRLRRGPDRRAWRRVHRPGPCRDPAARAGARLPAGQPAAAGAERHRGLGLLRRPSLHATRRWPRTSRSPGRAHARRAGPSYPTTYYQSTPRGRELDQCRSSTGSTRRSRAVARSKLGQLLDVAYTIEYGADSAQQSSLNLLYLLGYSGPGQLRDLRRVRTRSTTSRRKRPDPRRARVRARQARSRTGRSSSP